MCLGLSVHSHVTSLGVDASDNHRHVSYALLRWYKLGELLVHMRLQSLLCWLSKSLCEEDIFFVVPSVDERCRTNWKGVQRPGLPYLSC